MNKPQAGGDVYARCSKGSTAGRGAIAGWTPCPLCCASSNVSSATSNSPESIRALISSIPNTTKSLKLFSHGRGLAAHLHAVHTPWKPGKAEVKRRKALLKRQENEKRRMERSCAKEDGAGDDDHVERCNKRQKLSHDESTIMPIYSWHPTEEETKRWNEQVVEIVALTEAEANKKIDDFLDGTVKTKPSNRSMKGCDRNGKEHQSYRDSLPAFLAAAADGDLNNLKKMIENIAGDENDHIRNLLSLEDRNGSTAEHWAAGGGHIKCIQYIWDLKDRIHEEDGIATTNSSSNNNNDTQMKHTNKKVVRRRDGKTALHYAARNGRNEMIDLILSRKDAPSVNIISGDGTTPLHMACYGGYASTVKHLVEKHASNALAMNDWNCGAAHFAAMSLGNEGADAVIALCEYLKHDCGVYFTSRQKQGHTPLHKAASRKNRHVIEWLARETKLSTKEDMEDLGGVDDGGNSASSIWLSVGGDEDFGQWMKNTCSSW